MLRSHKDFKNNIAILVQAGLIAAMYVVLTALSAALGLAYTGVQLRISEAITILPVFMGSAIPGLTVGCFFANLASPYGLIDIVAGTLATFVSAVLTRALRHVKFKGVPLLAPLPSVIISGFLLGFLVCSASPEGFRGALFWSVALSVSFSEALVCYGMGLPLFMLLDRSKLLEVFGGST